MTTHDGFINLIVISRWFSLILIACASDVLYFSVLFGDYGNILMFSLKFLLCYVV